MVTFMCRKVYKTSKLALLKRYTPSSRDNGRISYHSRAATAISWLERDTDNGRSRISIQTKTLFIQELFKSRDHYLKK